MSSSNAILDRDIKVLLMTDNTGSMGQACDAARNSFDEIRTQLALLMGRECVDIAAIGDYDRSTPNSKQGGWAHLKKGASKKQISQFMDTYIKPCGGGEFPEAYKTGFNHILRLEEIPDIVLMFCDAVPHGVDYKKFKGEKLDQEGQKEKKYIEMNKMIWDWQEIGKALKKSNVRVVTFLTSGGQSYNDIWKVLGDTVIMNMNTSTMITRAMLWIFNALTGQPYDEPDHKEFTVDHRLEPVTKIDLSSRVKNADPDAVMTAFESLLDVETPSRAMCLSTNDVLGKYWRLICGKFKFMDNRKYETRCQKIMDKLSACMEKLSAADKAIMKAWIDRSFNETPKIREIIHVALNERPSAVITLPEDMKSNLTIDEVLSFGRGGNYLEVAKFVASLQMESYEMRKFEIPEDEDIAPSFIPTNLPASTLFNLIANLLRPGLLFSQAESLMVAILALKNIFLADIAYEFLLKMKGKWIKWDLDADGKQLFSSFWSLNFIRLLNLAPNEVLAQKEIEFRDHYLRVSKIIRNHDAVLQIIIPLIFSGLRLMKTWKRPCLKSNGGCGHPRCFTLFPGDSLVCALCINGLNNQDELYGKPSTIVEKDEIKANWGQCYTCKLNYTVAAPERLNVRPKCHYCRNNLKIQSVQCCTCLNMFANPGGSAILALKQVLNTTSDKSENARIIERVLKENEFICPGCVGIPSQMIKEVEVKVSDIIDQNEELIKIIPVGPYENLMNNNVSLWKRVLSCNDLDEKEIYNTQAINRLYYEKFAIHNPQKVADLIKTTLLSHSGFTTCQMCISDVSVRSIVPACGNCPNRICESCVRGWYSQVQIGYKVQKGNCHCPFCKAAPSFKTLRGLDVQHIRNLRPTRGNNGIICQWDPRSVYGVCRDCLNISIVMAQECARENLPEIRNFTCEPCSNARANNVLIKSISLINSLSKECPNCHVSIEKAGGCNHITCTCDAHFCWVCLAYQDSSGKPFDSHTIYDHLRETCMVFGDDFNDDDD
jgi:hypothetical protein